MQKIFSSNDIIYVGLIKLQGGLYLCLAGMIEASR